MKSKKPSTRLLDKAKEQDKRIEAERNKARLKYPVDVRIYLAQKNADMNKIDDS